MYHQVNGVQILVKGCRDTLRSA